MPTQQALLVRQQINDGNNVTFCSTIACGSIFSIFPAQRLPGTRPR
jgi:hypothetical protein